MDIIEFFKRLSNDCFNKIDLDRKNNRLKIELEGNIPQLLKNIDLLAREMHMLVEKEKEDAEKQKAIRTEKTKDATIFIIDVDALLDEFKK